MLHFEKAASASALMLGVATFASFPAIADAMPRFGTETAIIMVGPACVAAIGASAVTALVLSRSASHKIDALQTELDMLRSELAEYDEESATLVGRHAVVDNAQCSLQAIVEAREAASVQALQAEEDLLAEQAEAAQSLADSYCKNPLESIEDKEDVPHKADGMHTAIEVQEDEDEPKVVADVDLEQIAEAYVQKKSFKERMVARSKGVQNVLRERLSAKDDMMQDIPVIRRADGSVGDVGESWWNAEDVSSTSYVSDTDFGIDEPTLAESATRYTAFVDASISASFARVHTSGAESDTRDSSGFVPRLVAERSDISARVADPFAPEGGQADAWQLALKAMEEKIDDNLITGAPKPLFADMVGDSDTLDEPDGLEDETRFLSFKAPAGHPEVTDTASYVNFLVENEFEARSKGFAKHVKRYLKVS